MSKLGNLRIVFRITVSEAGTYTRYTDSPDQDAFDIPLNKVAFEDGNVRFEVKSLNAVYDVKLINNAAIKGKLKPRDGSFPLTLKRVDEVPVRKVLRPQKPKKTYPYKEEEAFYENKKLDYLCVVMTMICCIWICSLCHSSDDNIFEGLSHVYIDPDVSSSGDGSIAAPYTTVKAFRNKTTFARDSIGTINPGLDSDFTLMPDSPCIGKGFPDTDVAEDYTGKAFLLPPSLGAFEQ